MARPTKFTTKTKRRIYKAIRLGASKRSACAYAGISYETMRGWERKGEQEEKGPFSAFIASIKRAEGEACIKALEAINDAMDKHWTAAAWMLERRYPEEYGKHQRVQLETLTPPEVVEEYCDPWLVEDEEESLEV